MKLFFFDRRKEIKITGNFGFEEIRKSIKSINIAFNQLRHDSYIDMSYLQAQKTKKQNTAYDFYTNSIESIRRDY